MTQKWNRGVWRRTGTRASIPTKPARDVNILAGHVRGLLGAEVDAHVGGILRFDQGVEGACKILLGVLEGDAQSLGLVGNHFADTRALGRARADRVHGDAVPTDLKREGAREAKDGHLGGGVGGTVDERALAGYGADVHDPARAPFLHDGHHVLAAEEHAGHIHPEAILPAIHGDLFEGPHLSSHTRVVDEDVDGAVGREGVPHHLADRALGGDVRGKDQAGTALIRDLLGRFLEIGLGAGHEHHFGAFFGHSRGDHLSDALAGACDDGDFVFESQEVLPLQFLR